MHPQTTLATTDRRVSALGRGAACLLALGTLLLPTTSVAGELPDHQTLVAALKSAVGTDNGGFEYDLWATVVDRDGVVRAVAFSGADVAILLGGFPRMKGMERRDLLSKNIDIMRAQVLSLCV